MKKQYYITEIGHLPGKVLDFDKAIMVKVIPSDFVHFFYHEQNDPDYEERVLNEEKLLVFKNYSGKEGWLDKKWHECEKRKYWEIDLEDFTPAHLHENRPNGEILLRSMYMVNLVNSSLDIVEAKDKGMHFSVKTGSQRLLEKSNLKVIGGDRKYYLIGYDKEGYGYGISYNSPERDEGGNFKVDKLICEDDRTAEGGIRVMHIAKRNAGIFAYMTGQLFTFAD